MPAAEITFTVDRTNIQAGECVTFYWKVEHVREVYFFVEGQRWQDHGVVGEGRRQECPHQSTSYNLRVVRQDGSVEIRQIPIQVQTAAPAPQITFTVDRTNIRAGECVTFHWKVEGVRAVYFHREGERWQDHGVVGEGRQQECPPHSTNYNLRVVKQDNSVETRQIPIQVKTAPPPPPAADKPVIHAFSVTPGQIKLGESVNLSWQTGGGTSWVKIVSGDRVVYPNAPQSGTTTDQPRQAGTVPYRIIAYNPEEKRVFEVREVNVVT
jgi:plastocyanin